MKPDNRPLPRIGFPLTLLACGALIAAAPADGQTAPACADPEYRQLDFWLGDWDVRTPEGEVLGTSTVRPIMGGCAVQEEWESGAFRGRSISVYDKPDSRWEQLWVDNAGTALRQTGEWSGSELGWRAERRGSDGVVRALRVTLTPMEDGVVRQLQERSEDQGASWTVIFDGRYHPRGPHPGGR